MTEVSSFDNGIDQRYLDPLLLMFKPIKFFRHGYIFSPTALHLLLADGVCTTWWLFVSIEEVMKMSFIR